MLHKYPRPAYRKHIKNVAKVLFVSEALAFVGSYGVWYKLNTDREFRLYMHNHCTFVLDAYYKIGQLIDAENKCRAVDLSVWRAEGRVHD